MAKSKLPAQPNGKATGRPTVFSDQLAQRILQEIAAGDPLTEIFKRPGMPSWVTFWTWLDQEDKASFSNDVARARHAGQIARIERGVTFARNLVKRCKDGSREQVNAGRELLTHERWIAERQNRQEYGQAPTAAVSVVINTGLSWPEEQGEGSYTLELEADSSANDAPAEGGKPQKR